MGQIVLSIEEVANQLGLDPTVEEAAVIDRSITTTEGMIRTYLRYDPVQRTRTEYYTRQDFTSDGVAIWDVSGSSAVQVASGRTAIELQLRHLPIRSVTSIKIDTTAKSGTAPGAFPAGTEKVEGVDFWPNYDIKDSDGNAVCHDGVLKSDGIWPPESGKVEVTYVAGYTAEEFAGEAGIIDASAIYGSIIEEASRMAKGAFLHAQSGSIGWVAGTIESERLGDYSYSVGTSSGQRGSTSDRYFGGVTALLPSTAQRLSGFVNWAIAE